MIGPEREDLVVHLCPLCNRAVNRQGEPFDEPYKTRAHIDGAHDEQHEGERGREYIDRIREHTRRITDSERRVPEHGDDEGDLSGHEVEVALGVGESMKMPVERAVKLNATRIADPEGSGIASQGTAWELRQENRELREELNELRERVATLETAVEAMSAEAVDDECTDCGGRLRVEVRGEEEPVAVCEECGERRAEVLRSG